MQSPYFGAFLRALMIGLLSGASTFLATWSTTDDAKALGIATATAFLAPFLVRFGGEGTYDTNRDTKIVNDLNSMKQSDVGFAKWGKPKTSDVPCAPGSVASAPAESQQ